MTKLLGEIGVSGLVDIVFMALLIYSILVWLKTTRRAAAVLAGILIVAVVYLLAQQFELQLTVAVFQGFFAVFLVALVVIFQEELRYFFERIAAWGLGRKLPLRPSAPGRPAYVEALLHTLTDLARERVGALIVLRGHDLLERHLDGGEELDGKISEPLLKSLFDPHSIGHDGAVVIENGRVTRFGSHLPLSKNKEMLLRVGTRHAAALGVSELTDALCLVVSEERGAISVARHGRLRPIADPVRLLKIVEEFHDEMLPQTGRSGWRELLKANAREKVVALGLALALWFVLVHEARTVYRSYEVPVEFAHVPDGLRVARVEPGELEVTFSAPRKSFYFVKPTGVRLAVRTWSLTPGRTVLPVATSDLKFPSGLVLENVEPGEIAIEVESTAPPRTGP